MSDSLQTSAFTQDAQLLRWRTRETSGRLASVLMVSLGVALVTGLVLWWGGARQPFHQWLVLMHVGASSLATLCGLPFVVLHLRDGQEPLRALLWPVSLWRTAIRHGGVARKRLIGHVLLWGLLLVLGTGLISALPGLTYLLDGPGAWPYGVQHALMWAHRWATLALMAALAWHLPRQDRGRNAQ